MSIRATVVIATKDRPAQLESCLRSVVGTIGADDEIIVVDSASDDPESVQTACASYGARLFRTESGGSAKARNLGLRQARGDIIAFTDDDAIVCRGWLDALVTRLSAPDVAAAVGPVFELGAARRTLLFSFADFDAANDVVSFDCRERDWLAGVHYGAIGSGANLAVRRSAFERYGVFRESLGCGAPISGDETFYLLALIAAGERVVNEPLAQVYHPKQRALRQKELRRCRVAYLSYLGLALPSIRMNLLRTIFRRRLFRRPMASMPSARTSPLDIIWAVFSTPPLLMAARRIDHLTDSSDAYGPELRQPDSIRVPSGGAASI